LSITSLGISGSNPGDFAEVADTCGTSVAAGDTCTIAVTFAPSGAGQQSATLSITDSGSNSPQVANLTGTGIHDVILSWGASPSIGISGYNIYRGTSPGGESSTPLNSAPVDSNTYVDDSVTPGTTYYYVLRTVNSVGGESAPSNEANAQVPSS
jgi:predicted phage tail protein